jgi:hypothetical protein
MKLANEAEIRSALERVVTSPNFRASPQLASFLRFVVEETLAGRADRLKGYSVAIGALGRNHTFDPRTNPIVRVEAGRLRQALERYYAGPGRDDKFVIALPRGSYIPTFGHRRVGRGLQAFAIHGRRLIRRAARPRFRLVVLVACIAAAVSATFKLVIVPAEQTVGGGLTPVSTFTGPYWTATAVLSVVTIVSIVVAWWIS